MKDIKFIYKKSQTLYWVKYALWVLACLLALKLFNDEHKRIELNELFRERTAKGEVFMKDVSGATPVLLGGAESPEGQSPQPDGSRTGHEAGGSPSPSKGKGEGAKGME